MGDKIHVKDLHTRDVCIVPWEKEQKYFLYDCFERLGQKGRAVNVRESSDLVWWSESYPVFEPDENFWGPLDFWAPECHYWRGKYYMVSSFRAPGGYRGCQFLEAETPRGPFLPKKNKPATPENWHCLDGTLYEDRQGKPWMVFCHEWLQVQDGQICAIRMEEDLSDSIGEPVILFRASEAPWRFTDDRDLWKLTEPQPKMGWARVTDGPYLYRAKTGSCSCSGAVFPTQPIHAVMPVPCRERSQGRGNRSRNHCSARTADIPWCLPGLTERC